MIIGFSTGCFWRHVPEITGHEAVELVRQTGANAIEISAVSIDRARQLASLSDPELKDFSYISLHGPAVSASTRPILDCIQAFCERIPVGGVVIHPDLVEDFSLFDSYSFPVAFENMDNRKSFGTSPDDMQNVFDRVPTSRFCLDIQHIHTLDETMKSVNDFLPRFQDRLCHVHLSGGSPQEDGFLYHAPIYQTQQDIIIEHTPREAPIIIESDFVVFECCLKDCLRQEYNYIVDRLT